MTKSDLAPETRSRLPDENYGYNDLFGNGHPLVNHARQVMREAFAQFPCEGPGGGKNNPELYPELRTAGPSADRASCDVCNQSKSNCACWSW